MLPAQTAVNCHLWWLLSPGPLEYARFIISTAERFRPHLAEFWHPAAWTFSSYFSKDDTASVPSFILSLEI